MRKKIAFYASLTAMALFLCSCVTTKDRLITKEYQLKIAYMVSLNPVGGVIGATKKERIKPEKWNHLSDQDFRTICWLEKNGIEFESVEGAWLIHHGLLESGKLKEILPNYGYIEVHNTVENHKRIEDWIQGIEDYQEVMRQGREKRSHNQTLLDNPINAPDF